MLEGHLGGTTLACKHEVLGLIPALQKEKELGQSGSRLIIQYLSAYRMPDLVLSTERAVVNRQGVVPAVAQQLSHPP